MTPSKETQTIKAYGLVTRYWTYKEAYGYGCAECCTGDRCDEDCTAKCKGNRKGCPHCKGKGWIKKENLDPELNAELQDQITREAEAYLKQTTSTSLKDAYEAGAANYALYKEQWGQAKKALEKIKEIAKRHGEIRDIINTALSSWKEEGKGGEGNELITVECLEKLGFNHEDLGDETPYDKYVKHGIEVWDFNGRYWLVDMLDQAGIDREFHYLHELEQFFNGCGLSIYR